MSTFRSVVNAEQFRTALSNALRSALKRAKIPVLEEAMVCFEEDRCTITCTNLTQWCQVVIPARGDAFSFVFPQSKSILAACQHFPGDLEISFTNDPTKEQPDPEGKIELRNGGRGLQRRTIFGSEFPVMPQPTFEQHYPIDADKLLERFKRVKYALSCNHDRPARCCVEFLDHRIVTVDGYRLAVSSDPDLTVEKPFFIPPEAMAELQMFRGQDCTLSVGKEWAAFENKSIRLFTRIPSNDGLDVDNVIPTAFSGEYPISVSAFWDEVKYLREFITAKNRKPIRFNGLSLALETEEGSYYFSGWSPEIAEQVTENVTYVAQYAQKTLSATITGDSDIQHFSEGISV